MSRRALASLAALAIVSSLGCSPSFEALTTPPPFTRAELCDRTDACDHDRVITLTRGIALAFECFSPNGGDPCTGVRAQVADPAIASVFEGYVDTLSPSNDGAGAGVPGAQPRSTLVVVGREVGTTTLSISSDQGDADFEVRILAP